MYKLSKAAQAAGVTLLNEVGLDPGIDHMLAMQCIDEVSRQGGTVESFISWCGGLPAPEFSNNPLRYKFSWSPRTVLANLKNSAKYLKNGTLVDIPAGGWLMQSAMPVDVLPGFNLEGIPNRDSTVFSEKYGLSCAHTVLRGTLRFTVCCLIR
jgi:alpha-aminoadipic semialdehyde synthase